MNLRSSNDVPRAATLKKVAIYSAIFFIIAVAQCSFFANLTFLGVVPNLVIGAVAAISLFESEHTSAVASIGAGFLTDALGGSGISISPLLFLSVALLLSALSKKILKGFFPWILLLTVANLFGIACTYLRLLISNTLPSTELLFKTIILPEFFYTLLFSLPLYFIFKFAARLGETKGRFKI